MVDCWGGRRRSIILLLFLHCMIYALLGRISEGISQTDETMRLELIHKATLYAGKQPKSRLELMRELLHNDIIRQQGISHRLRQRLRRSVIKREVRETTASNTNATSSRCEEDGDYVSAEMPIHSGADYGAGQYFVMLTAGTPGQKFMLIADTGTELTWMNCRYRCRNCWESRHRRRRVFRADHSPSFKTVPCSSRMCKIELMNLFSLARCPSPLSPCAFDYRYSDGSAAVGVFANETLTVDLTNGRKMKLHNMLIGCSESSKIQSFRLADGVMGLGYSKYSFATIAANKFGGKFSYCLVDHLSTKNVSNYLVFGAHKELETKAAAMQYTELVLGVMNPFYAVNLKGISVGGNMLEIPKEVWHLDGVGGTILDSGTSLTLLTVPAYKPVMAALKVPLLKFQKLDLDIGPLEYCFNSTGFQEGLLPRLEIHFADGALFRPKVKSYIIDAAKEVKCLGFVSTNWPGTSVIGNIMQQNHLWEFDLLRSKLGYAPSTCT